MRRYKVRVTTAADGSATAYTPRVSGKVHQIEYVKDTASAGANAFADTVDFAIKTKDTGIGLWTEANVTASAVRAPRQPAHSQVGAALLYAAGGTAVTERIALGNDMVEIAITNGGNAKVGTFHVLIDN